MNAIILGLGVNGLAVVRSLGSQGLTLAGIYFDDNDLGQHSKYLTQCTQLDVDYTIEDLLSACLNFINGDKHKPIIFCSTDKFAEEISKHQKLFEKHFIITTPQADMYWRFVAKQPTVDICIENNIPIPKTAYTLQKNGLLNKTANFQFPVIIKPNLTFDDEFPGKNVIASEQAELTHFLQKYPNTETKVVVQEVIPSGDGKIFIVSCFSDNNGKVRAIYTGRKIRQYLPDYGVTCFGVSESNSYLKQLTINFLENINYTGYATLEFAYDEMNSQYYFIELNIRTFYHNQLFKDAGIDINYIAYKTLTENAEPQETNLKQQIDNIYWLDFTRDLGSFLRKRNLKAIDWFTSIIKARSFAYFDSKDLKPFAASLKALVMLYIKRIRKK